MKSNALVTPSASPDVTASVPSELWHFSFVTHHFCVQGRKRYRNLANLVFTSYKQSEGSNVFLFFGFFFFFLVNFYSWLCQAFNKLWKILKEMGIPDHLTCLLRNLYTGQEVTVRTGHGTTDWFQTGKGVRQGCILSPCLFNFYAEYIMRNAGLDEAQAGIKIAGRNINNLRYADDTTLMIEWRRTEEPLDESERGEWKCWCKAQHSEN